MKKTVFAIFIIFSLLFFNSDLKATFFMGGEITWECLSTGQFKFHFIFYRECGGITMPSSRTIESNSPAGYIYMSLISGWPKDITPKGDSYSGCQQITCAWAEQTWNDNTGAISEYHYVSAPITLNGVPPSNGWTFYYESCCRLPLMNIYNGTSKSFKLRSVMYPYNNQNTYPCFDNSPYFAEVPTTLIGTGYEATLNNNAIDKDFDELTYSWGRLRESDNSIITDYAAGYYYDSPFPNTSHNSNNSAAVLDDNGVIHLKSYTTGPFAYSTKVSARKNGILTAEIFRETTAIIDSSVIVQNVINTPPGITPPFDSNTVFSDTLIAGDSITFLISISDLQYSPNSYLPYQDIEFWVTDNAYLGDFISTGTPHFSDSIGCIYPPCATITNAQNDTMTGNGMISKNFSWLTNCNHINGINSILTTNKISFLLNVKDRLCPFPSIKTYTVNIVLKSKPIVESPKISCVKVLSNGEVEIKWNKIQDTLNSFKNFNLYLWDSNNSTLADSIYDISDYQDTIQNINANTSSKSIFINTVSSCNFETLAYDTVSTMFLEANENLNGTIELNWNPIRNDNQQHIYKIYKEYPVGNRTLYNTTANTSFTDNAIHVGEIVNYYIETEDSVITSSGSFSCNSMSNIASIIATSIKDSELSNKITIYPNPADDIITIEYGKLKINMLEVYNSNSKLVFQDSELTSKSYKLIPDNLASGTYFLKFYVEDKIVYKKLIIN